MLKKQRKVPPPKKQNKSKPQEKKSLKSSKGLRYTFLTGVGALFVAIIVALTPSLFQYFLGIFKPDPIFGVEHAVRNPKLPIVIIAKNISAKRKEPLDVRWDGFCINQAAIPKSNPDVFEWEFTISTIPNTDLPDEYKKDGVHQLEVGFRGKFFEPMNVSISSKAPVVEAIIQTEEGNPGSKILMGRTISERQDPKEEIKLDIIFYNKAAETTWPISVEKRKDSKGRIYFAFKTPNIVFPEISPNDPLYKETFFAFQVSDQAGNRYYQNLSYAQFVAPGAQHFGLFPIADIDMHKYQEVDTQQTVVNMRLEFELMPIQIGKTKYKGTDVLQLKAFLHGTNSVKLVWTKLPEEIRAENPSTIIFRDSKALSFVFGDNYIDKSLPPGKSIKYQVAQADKKGVYYKSVEKTVERQFKKDQISLILRGQVASGDIGKPVAGVHISSPGGLASVTDSNGKFKLEFSNKKEGDSVLLKLEKEGSNLLKKEEYIILKDSQDYFVTIFMYANREEEKGQGNILLAEKLIVDPAANLSATPISFCVTEDMLYLFPDTKSGTIKVFGKEGRFLKFNKTFRGGNELFTQPRYCFYSRTEGKLGIIDYGVRKGFIFKRSGQVNFELINTFECSKLGYDIKFAGDGIQTIVSGYITDGDGNPFDLYSINIKTGQIDYLLPSYLKYGMKTHEEYVEEYFEKQTLPAIGIKAFIDIQGDDLFFAWEGALRIIKLNLRSKEITRVFGQVTLYYNKLVGSSLIDSYKNAAFRVTWKDQKTIAYIRNIFATPRHVFVVYETGKKNEGDVSTFRLQTYSLEGLFLNDVSIPSTPGRQMCFDKESYELYAFTDGSDNDKGGFAILKYKISR